MKLGQGKHGRVGIVAAIRGVLHAMPERFTAPDLKRALEGRAVPPQALRNMMANGELVLVVKGHPGPLTPNVYSRGPVTVPVNVNGDGKAAPEKKDKSCAITPMNPVEIAYRQFREELQSTAESPE